MVPSAATGQAGPFSPDVSSFRWTGSASQGAWPERCPLPSWSPAGTVCGFFSTSTDHTSLCLGPGPLPVWRTAGLGVGQLCACACGGGGAVFCVAGACGSTSCPPGGPLCHPFPSGLCVCDTGSPCADQASLELPCVAQAGLEHLATLLLQPAEFLGAQVCASKPGVWVSWFCVYLGFLSPAPKPSCPSVTLLFGPAWALARSHLFPGPQGPQGCHSFCSSPPSAPPIPSWLLLALHPGEREPEPSEPLPAPPPPFFRICSENLT